MMHQIASDFRKISVIVISTWFLWLVLLFALPLNIAQRGQLGDLFGGVTALFTGLALAAVLHTVYLQRKEISNQNNELRISKRIYRQQNALHRATLRQNAQITMFNYYNQRIQLLTKENERKRSPSIQSEIEVLESYRESLLSRLEDLSLGKSDDFSQ